MAGMILFATVSASVAGVAAWVRGQVRQRRSLEQELVDSRREAESLSAELTITKKRFNSVADNMAGVLVLDRLEVIDGLTPHHARLLNAAGVLTYRDLAQSTPDRITILIAPAGGARLDVKKWIGQARELLGAVEPLPTGVGGQ